MLVRLLAFLLVAIRCGVYALVQWPRLKKDADNPDACQQHVLRRILQANRNTRLGADLRFSEIANATQYAATVPVHEYEHLRPYVMRQISEGTPEVVSEPPVFYAKTSGTTGQPKFIPVTASSLSALRRTLNLMSFRQFVARPWAFSGGLATLTSGPEEGRLSSGVPYGSTSGLVYAQSPRIFAKKFVIPPEVLALEDFELRYRLMLAIGLRRSDTTYLATANPSTVLILQQHLEQCTEALLSGLENGSFMAGRTLPDTLRVLLRAHLRARPRRAAWLRKRWQENGRLTIADIWPRIRLLGTWTSGSCGMALESVRALLPSGITVMDLGYLASEFRGTVPLYANDAGGLPTLRENYFEFVEQTAWEAGRREFLGLHQLRQGENYYVFITTRTGLYRYDMNDIIIVTGYFRRTPMLRFVQKGKGVTSITGEKLYESQALIAWERSLASAGRRAEFFVLTADIAAARYRAYVQLDNANELGELAARLDAELCAQNVEYRDKRMSGRLKPVEVCALKQGTSEAYRRGKVAAGQRDSQFKVVALCYREETAFDFEGRIIERSGATTDVG